MSLVTDLIEKISDLEERLESLNIMAVVTEVFPDTLLCTVKLIENYGQRRKSFLDNVRILAQRIYIDEDNKHQLIITLPLVDDTVIIGTLGGYANGYRYIVGIVPTRAASVSERLTLKGVARLPALDLGETGEGLTQELIQGLGTLFIHKHSIPETLAYLLPVSINEDIRPVVDYDKRYIAVDAEGEYKEEYVDTLLKVETSRV